MSLPAPANTVSPSGAATVVTWPAARTLPAPSVISSPSSPAITTSSPAPVVIVSLPPVSGSSVQMRSRSAGSRVDRGAVDEAVVAEHDRVAVGVGGRDLAAVGSDRVAVDAADDDVVPPRPVVIVSAPPTVGVDAGQVAERERAPSEILSPGPPWPSTVVAKASRSAPAPGCRAPGRSRGRGRGRRRRCRRRCRRAVGRRPGRRRSTSGSVEASPCTMSLSESSVVAGTREALDARVGLDVERDVGARGRGAWRT